MATIPNPASPKFPDVYQIETSDPVQGGPNGVSNKSTKDLVERTQYLNLNKANTTTKIVAGNGLTGGGTLGSDTTVTLGTPGALTDTSTDTVTDEGHTHSLQKSSTTAAGIVQLNDTLTSDSTTLALTAKQGKALKAHIDKAISFFTTDEALPTKNIGLIWHEKYASIMEWVVFDLHGAKYTGYASVEIGRIPNETQPTLRKGYIRSGASSYNQVTYSALWNWAKHNNLVKPKNEWQPKTLNYRDNEDGTFTPPDLRDQFPRFSTDGREFGSFQGDAIRNIKGQFWDILYQNYGKAQIEEKGACGSGLGAFQAGATEWDNGINVNQAAAYAPPIGTSTVTMANDGITFDASRVVPTSNENRSVNTDFLAAIKY